MAYEFTYQDAIESAMGHLKVLEVGEALEGDDFKIGWLGLLSMLQWWTRYKVYLHEPTTPTEIIVNTDDVPLPEPSLMEILATNLAMHLQPKYGSEISQSTAIIADEGIKDLKRIGLIAWQKDNPVTLEVSRMVGNCQVYDINEG